MITAYALASCIFAASHTYAVPHSVILGVLHVEGGKIGMASANKNGTHDLGPMQINTLWVPELSRYWGVSEAMATRMVRDDACVNIGVGAWILRKKMDQTGSLYKGIAYYHSGTPKLGNRYRKKVLKAMQAYHYIQQQDDLISAYTQAATRRPG